MPETITLFPVCVQCGRPQLPGYAEMMREACGRVLCLKHFEVQHEARFPEPFTPEQIETLIRRSAPERTARLLRDVLGQEVR